MITNKLEGYTLTGIIAAVDQYIIKEGRYYLSYVLALSLSLSLSLYLSLSHTLTELFHPAYNILHSVSKVPRFHLVLMFLKDDDKSGIIIIIIIIIV